MLILRIRLFISNTHTYCLTIENPHLTIILSNRFYSTQCLVNVFNSTMRPQEPESFYELMTTAQQSYGKGRGPIRYVCL